MHASKQPPNGSNPPRSMFQPQTSAPQLRSGPRPLVINTNGHSVRPIPPGPPNYAAMSYSDLVQYAESQRQRIETNNAAIQHKEAKLRMLQQGQKTPQTYSAVQSRLKALRAEVSREDADLARLRKLQGELDTHREVNITAKSELGRLQQMFSSKEKELREAVTKVETLRNQLDQLQRRRQSAASAAVEMATKAAIDRDQKIIQEKARLGKKQAELKNLDTKIEDMINQLKQEKSAVVTPERPKAAVEPFHRTPPQHFPDSADATCITVAKAAVIIPQPNNNETNSKGYNEALKAVQETLEEGRSPVKESETNFIPIQEKPNPENTSLFDLKGKVPSFKPNRASNDGARGSPSLFVRREPIIPNSNPMAPPSPDRPNAPSPPRLYATTSYIHSTYTAGKSRTSPQGSDHSSISSTDSESAQQKPAKPPVAAKPTNRRLPVTAIKLDSEPPDLIPQSEKSQFGLSTVKEDSSGSDTPTDQFYSHITSDKLHIRSDNLRARKRTSWAREATSSDETEHIRNLLRREQQKGRSNINLSWIFKDEAANKMVVVERSEPKEEKSAEPPKEEPEIRPPPPYPFHLYPPEQKTTTATMEESSSSDSESRSESVTVIDVDPEIQLAPPPAIGILKPPGKRSTRGRIEFDPLAMLLDAALEGELDLVKKSAKKIKQVSLCNDEGITALHNAICAGHYEIVRFLVDAHGDVNAQDSDGWTPLHCAASCNNLPMVKFLVERGSCVFATTVSDHETPADKCEEEEDGFDGCYQFLLNIQDKLGYMNDGEVFAAYAYDAEREDELSFEEGDALTILNRKTDSAELGWWWARHRKSQKEGYVPRNYLALYPRLSSQASHVSPLDKEEVEEGEGEVMGASTDTLDQPNVVDTEPVVEAEEYEINIIDFSDDDKPEEEEDEMILTVTKSEPPKSEE